MKKTITIVICFLAISWSLFFMFVILNPKKVVNLGITEQRKIYSSEMTVYLDNKPLPACSEDIETRICRYSCAPEGECIFIPIEILKKYNFE